jgi:hypothetical protein
MKKLLLAASVGVALTTIAGQALAVCTGNTRVASVAALTTLLQNRTVCVPAVTVPTMTWQEFHSGTSGVNNNLIDFKRGPGHAVDPSEPVGTWTISGNSGGQQAVVNHNYGAGGSFTYQVFDNGNTTFSFCNGANEFVARIFTGNGAC